ncbi:MAG: PEP-CTERM/exosortase system-associated acyltransferase [Flavobacteriales bacterium]
MFCINYFNLGRSFKKCFEIIPAFSENLRNEVFNIRHQVYCEELKFEPEKQDKLEIDEYDSHALHLLIRNIQTGEFIGCTRLILAQHGDKDFVLPLEEHCASSLDFSNFNLPDFPRQHMAEVSRLAVIKKYRRRLGDKDKPINISKNDFGSLFRPRFPYIPVGLFIGTIELARLNGITHLLMLTERRLAVHFMRLGANVNFIGKPIEHRGKRIPSVIDINEVIKNMRWIFRPLYRVIAKDIQGVSKNSKF